MEGNVFNRREKKYLMTGEVYEELRRRLAPYMAEDKYGLHTICNIYYDTPDHLLIRRSIEKPLYKEKLRLRSYGVPSPDARVYLEIKKKYAGIVNKRRIGLTLREAYAYLERGIRPQVKSGTEAQILKELDLFTGRYPLERSLYLAYDRVALFGRADGHFRVTFDRRIRSRRIFVALEAGDRGRELLPDDWVLMESKMQGAAPLWFSEILTDLGIFPTSFSKYGSIYRAERGRFDAADLMRHRFEDQGTGGRTAVC